MSWARGSHASRLGERTPCAFCRTGHWEDAEVPTRFRHLRDAGRSDVQAVPDAAGASGGARPKRSRTRWSAHASHRVKLSDAISLGPVVLIEIDSPVQVVPAYCGPWVVAYCFRRARFSTFPHDSAEGVRDAVTSWVQRKEIHALDVPKGIFEPSGPVAGAPRVP
jgi:hypothetical protein